jgi:hypothetical protein
MMTSDEYQFLRAMNREGSQNKRFIHAKDRGVGSDSERQRQNSGCRGQPGWKFRGDTVITEADSGILTMRIPYENVTLAMYGTKDSPDRQKYVAAIISWNNLSCDGK